MYKFAEKVDLILNVLTIKMHEAEMLNNEKVCRNSLMWWYVRGLDFGVGITGALCMISMDGFLYVNRTSKRNKHKQRRDQMGTS